MIGINDILAILPELIVAGSVCVLLLVDFLIGKENKALMGYLSLAVIFAAAIATWSMTRSGSLPVDAFNGMISVDKIAVFFKVIFFIATALTIMLSLSYIKDKNINLGEYYALLLFSLTGMMITASSSDLLSIYLGIELMSLPIYALVGFRVRDGRANEGAMKYVILGAFSSAVMLFGISFIYGLTGTTEISGIAEALRSADAQPAALGIAIVMLVAGFGFKIAGVPFHMWAPDAYEAAPTPITAFMSVAAKTAAFVVFVRVFVDGFAPIVEQWQLILTVLAILSMLVGNTVAIAQTNIKRMLAYSSIGHGGYALLGIIAATPEGTSSVMFYLLVYAFMNLGIFGVIVMMNRDKSGGELITDYTGLAKKNGALALVMLIFLFSLAGIPPTAGFMGKFYVFMALINEGMVWLAVVAVIFSAVAAYFYIRVIMLMYMKEPEREFSYARPLSVLIVITISLIAVILLGVLPDRIIELAEKAVGIL